ncbi:hypothetical protein FJTKL_05443 [Diaporthe vaccinii]|uniref:Secreted protein n=1 Tax=Diaporthe vaccinii TaxID=105482 RepID=A0ABR4FFW1_9PEZI
MSWSLLVFSNKAGQPVVHSLLTLSRSFIALFDHPVGHLPKDPHCRFHLCIARHRIALHRVAFPVCSRSFLPAHFATLYSFPACI